MYRVAVLVKQNAHLSAEQFKTRWLDGLVPAIAVVAGKNPNLRRLVMNIAPAELDAEVARVFPPPFDGLLEFWFDSAEDAAAGMKEISRDTQLHALAATIVDGPAGVAWLARVVPSKPESGSHFKFLAAGEVAHGVSLEDAHKYWRDTHPVVAQTAPEVWGPLTRYTQFHGVPAPQLEMGDWLARARFVPMCSDMGFARQRGFIDVYTSKQYADIVRPDEEKFSRPGEMLAFISAEERDVLA
ncbi:MAG: hypothetical protein JWM78_3695 [Verrucomicrobiaceae bacterium]|nr:hypothetical protein [Verrucomicrobiaceae bacterium]